MKPEEKANELIEKYKDYVHGYVGSSMLTNHEYPEQIIKQAKKAALIAVYEIILELKKSDSLFATNFLANYWIDVKKELLK